jgi:5-methylcytosine-specific restriction endonuclease McrA
MLEDRALVLNRSWTAISTTSVRRAVVLLVRGAAGVVHPTTYQLHSWEQWLEQSADVMGDGRGALDEPQPGEVGADGGLLVASGDVPEAERPRSHDLGRRPGRAGAGSRAGRPGGPGRLLGFGLSICVPEVIALRTYDGYPVRGVSFTRRNVYKRDGHTCQYCGGRPGLHELTIDHVIPRSRGGASTWENCVTACRPCNARKANRLAHELDLTLRKPPTAPRWPGGLDPASVRARPLWQRFLPASAVVLTA